MGWFWADAPRADAQVAPHPMPTGNAKPPPNCPMHKSDDGKPSPLMQNFAKSTGDSSCPVKSTPNAPVASPAPAAPAPAPSAEPSTPPKSSGLLSKMNPLNYMFSDLSQDRASNQTIDLPTDREISTIPRGGDDAPTSQAELWEYPSPQQMYNALLRKGYTDTPADAIESMVAVHNFLNEGAWAEIVQWERTFSAGLFPAWQTCKRGLENSYKPTPPSALDDPRLIRFMGRPKDLTPKATMVQVLGWLYPSKFGTEPPFDRHDWFVERQTPSGPKEVRYVIDYYSAPPEPTGEPVFYLDIRPAVDTPTAAVERLMRWGGDVWWRASGGVVREEKNE